MQRPNGIIKDYINQVSHLAEKDENELLKTIALMYLHQSNDEDKNEKVLGKTNKVGIWRRNSDNNDSGYVIDEDRMDEMNFWARNMNIVPKSTKKRVVLIGESAARGYFYDPVYNPAMELENTLHEMAVNEYEVIDLARTDLSYEMMINLINESAELNPDMVVLFAGNNWDVNDIWENHKFEVSKVIREEGLNGLVQYCNEFLVRNVENLYSHLNNLFTCKEIPVIVIIPEFNLCDWKDPDIGVNWLMDGECSRWNLLFDITKTMMDAGDYKDCIKMLETEESMHEYAGTKLWYSLAKSYNSLGMNDKAEQVYTKIKDITMIYPKINTPRAFSVVQEALKNAAVRYKGIQYIDMHDLFYQEGSLIGREFFMDYCHLSLKGIRILMRSVAGVILNQDISETINREMNIDKKVESQAHFLAAIHNAHWGQEDEIIQYHLEKAIMEWPEIRDTMKEFIDFQCRTLPIWMSKQTEGYIGGISEQGQRYLTENKGLLLDRKLIDAIGNVLKSEELVQHILEVRNKAYGLQRGTISLLSSDYYVNALSQKEAQYNWSTIPEKLRRYGYLTAYGEDTGFIFTTNQPVDIQSELIYRANIKSDEVKKVMISINQQEIGSYEITSDWQKLNLNISKEYIKEGINEINVQWPAVNDSMKEQREKIIDEIEKGITPEVVPIYGEIYKFVLLGA